MNLKLLYKKYLQKRSLDNTQEKLILFYKAKNNTKPGLGLGLFIAKEIINKHRGKILVQSKLNKGTTISVKLPFIKNA